MSSRKKYIENYVESEPKVEGRAGYPIYHCSHPLVWDSPADDGETSPSVRNDYWRPNEKQCTGAIETCIGAAALQHTPPMAAIPDQPFASNMADPRYAQPATLPAIQDPFIAIKSLTDDSGGPNSFKNLKNLQANLKGGQCFALPEIYCDWDETLNDGAGGWTNCSTNTIQAGAKYNITPEQNYNSVIYASKSNAGLLKNNDGTLCTQENNPQGYKINNDGHCELQAGIWGSPVAAHETHVLNTEDNIGYVCYEFANDESVPVYDQNLQPPVQGVFLSPPKKDGKIIDVAANKDGNTGWPEDAQEPPTWLGRRTGIDGELDASSEIKLRAPNRISGYVSFPASNPNNSQVPKTDDGQEIPKVPRCVRGTLAGKRPQEWDWARPLVQGSRRSPKIQAGEGDTYAINWGYTDIQNGSTAGTSCTGLCAAQAGALQNSGSPLTNISKCTNDQLCTKQTCLNYELEDTPEAAAAGDEFAYLFSDVPKILRDPADPIFALDKDTCLNLNGDTLWCDKGVGSLGLKDARSPENICASCTASYANREVMEKAKTYYKATDQETTAYDQKYKCEAPPPIAERSTNDDEAKKSAAEAYEQDTATAQEIAENEMREAQARAQKAADDAAKTQQALENAKISCEKRHEAGEELSPLCQQLEEERARAATLKKSSNAAEEYAEEAAATAAAAAVAKNAADNAADNAANSGGLSTGAIIGIVIGSLVGVLALLVALWYWARKSPFKASLKAGRKHLFRSKRGKHSII